jgi:hypothetical protein
LLIRHVLPSVNNDDNNNNYLFAHPPADLSPVKVSLPPLPPSAAVKLEAVAVTAVAPVVTVTPPAVLEEDGEGG